VTLSELRRRRADVYAVAQRYGVSNIRVFGSVARADADEASDVDLLVDLAPGRGLFDLGGFISGAEAALGVHVDATTVGAACGPGCVRGCWPRPSPCEVR
jgi:predicted nucleotidyltransferase